MAEKIIETVDDKLKLLEQMIGQSHLLKETGPIYRMIKSQTMYSLVLFGSPGIGKTTLAKLISEAMDLNAVFLNGANLTKADLKMAVDLSKQYGNVLIVIDEIHRLDIVKQDFLLQYLEKPNIFLIGTTTANPYFDLSSAIRSRCVMFNLLPVSASELIEYATANYQMLKLDVIESIVQSAYGDVRSTLNNLDFVSKNYESEEISIELINEIFTNNINFAKVGDEHYNLISALQKSIRASDVNAALHYAARLLVVGDYKIILRRLLIIAYEDIGLANPQACARTVSAIEAFERVGQPEGRIILANIIVDLALSPKSTTAYTAFDQAIADVEMLNIQTINPHITHRQDEKHKYDKEKARFMNLLPEEIKNKEYFKVLGKSRYEQALQENYNRRKKETNGRI